MLQKIAALVLVLTLGSAVGADAKGDPKAARTHTEDFP